MTDNTEWIDQLRLQDRDRYFLSLFYPERARHDVLALFAFNRELSRIQEITSELMVGVIRLKWWYDAIEQTFEGKPPPHPVALALSEVVANNQLDRTLFLDLVEARSHQLGGVAPETLEQLESEAASLSTPLIELSLSLIQAHTAQTAHTARHVGIAWSLCELIRAIPRHAMARKSYLPVNLCQRHKLDVEAVFHRSRLSTEGSVPEGLSAVVCDLTKLARSHVDLAREARGQLSKQAVPALLPLTISQLYLQNIERAAFDPFDLEVEAGPSAKLLRLGWNALRNRY